MRTIRPFPYLLTPLFLVGACAEGGDTCERPLPVADAVAADPAPSAPPAVVLEPSQPAPAEASDPLALEARVATALARGDLGPLGAAIDTLRGAHAPPGWSTAAVERWGDALAVRYLVLPSRTYAVIGSEELGWEHAVDLGPTAPIEQAASAVRTTGRSTSAGRDTLRRLVVDPLGIPSPYGTFAVAATGALDGISFDGLFPKKPVKPLDVAATRRAGRR